MEQKFTTIKDFKRVAYLPRLGKIRLGVKAVSQRTGKEYPKETDYFVCPPEVKSAAPIIGRNPETGEFMYGPPYYGEKPKLLDVMFPSDDQAQVIPFCYKCYGSNQKLKCKGNGETALWFNPEIKEMEERKCPCEALENGECVKRGHLMVMLPRVKLAGVYQIDTGSAVNINRILDTMDYWKMVVGRCKLLPLTLERVPEKIGNPKNGTMQTHYLFKFGANLNIDLLNQAIENNKKILTLDYKVEPPIEDGKLDDTPVEIIENGEIIEKGKKEDDLTDLGLGDKHRTPSKEEPKKQQKKEQKFLCENCGDPVSQAELGYSKTACAGRVLCFDCQKIYKKDKSQLRRKA